MMRSIPTLLPAAVFIAALPAAAATCTNISAVGLAFGSYDVFATLPDDTAASLTYSCTASPAVSFGPSVNGAQSPRQMLHVFGPDVLRYDVYFDAARTVVWSSTPIALPAGNRTLPFYGRIFAGQDVTTGFYVDAVTITLNF